MAVIVRKLHIRWSFKAAEATEQLQMDLPEKQLVGFTGANATSYTGAHHTLPQSVCGCTKVMCPDSVSMGERENESEGGERKTEC